MINIHEVQGVLIHPPDYTDYNCDDRMNVSKVHREIQHRSVTWMSNRLAPCFASIEIGYRGVCCDALGVGIPNEKMRQASKNSLWTGAIVRVEAKVSRSDFMATFGPGPKKGVAHIAEVGNLRFVAKPRAITMPLELLPEHWGVLEAYGAGLKLVRPATWTDSVHDNDLYLALCQIVSLHPWGKRSLRVPCPDCAEVAA